MIDDCCTGPENENMKSSNNKIFFVYVKQNGRICPQKWYEDKINSTTGKATYKEELLFKQELKENEYNLTMTELCEKYPIQKEEKK